RARDARHGQRRSAAAGSPADGADDDRSHEVEEDHREHRAEVEREAASAQGRDESPEDVQVGVGHLLDEPHHPAERPVVRHARDPAQQDADEDQDEIDDEHRLHVVGDGPAADGARRDHRNRCSEALTAFTKASSTTPSSWARPASVAPPGDATALRIARGSRFPRSSAVPAKAPATSSPASLGSRPSRSPALARASATSAMYAGELDMIAIAGSSSSSWSGTSSPSGSSSSSRFARSSSGMPSAAT